METKEKSKKPAVGFKVESLSDTLSKSEASDFLKLAMSVSGGMEADKWFYICGGNDSLLFLPKKDNKPPLESNDDLADITTVTGALLGKKAKLSDFKTPYWLNYIKQLVADHICVFVDNGEAASLNENLFTDEFPIPPYRLFLSFLNSLHSSLPFTLSKAGVQFVEDDKSLEAVKKIANELSKVSQNNKEAKKIEIDIFKKAPDKVEAL